MSEEESFKPDWDKIKTVSDKMEKIIDEGIQDKMNFIELDFSLYLVKEKINQEKHRVLNKIEDSEDKEKHNMYG
tara:strand:+ start:238 stop:459 length:222 start_codon:yes stop_codon:yes gene_type:complete